MAPSVSMSGSAAERCGAEVKPRPPLPFSVEALMADRTPCRSDRPEVGTSGSPRMDALVSPLAVGSAFSVGGKMEMVKAESPEQRSWMQSAGFPPSPPSKSCWGTCSTHLSNTTAYCRVLLSVCISVYALACVRVRFRCDRCCKLIYFYFSVSKQTVYIIHTLVLQC